MRALDSAELAAITQRGIVARDFVWVTAKDFTTGDPFSAGFWSDAVPVTCDVVDGRTGVTQSRDFYGVGNAMDIGSIPLTADVTVRSVDIELPAIDAVVAILVRGYDVRNAPMQLYRGYFDPATRVLLAAAKPRFVGYVDGSPIITPAEGGNGSVTLNCVSTTRELTRASTESRSFESQQARTGGSDAFYKDTAVVGDWILFWGVAGGTPALSPTATPAGSGSGTPSGGGPIA
jgi:hypothetical protein